MTDNEKGKLMQDLGDIFLEDMYPEEGKDWSYTETIKRIVNYINKHYQKKKVLMTMND